MRLLEGITVISLEHAIAAPFCTRQLADLGARVIKIERPERGDFARDYDTRMRGLSSHFVWANRSKESLAIDIKDQRSRALLDRLVAEADILVQNLAPGSAARMGLSYAALSETNPRLIVCNISGYGSSGPYRDRKAYDLLIQGEAGFLSVTGTAESPSKAGNSIADIAAGMYAYSAILAALIAREKTGKGDEIDISMMESMTEWMGYPMNYAFEGASPPERVGASHASIYPYGPFPTGDGSVILGVQNEREWAAFCNVVLNLPELIDDPRLRHNSGRSANRAELDRIIAGAFATRTSEQVLQLLDKAGIANAAVNDMKALWAHPQLKARGRWVDVETPAGSIPALLPPGLPKTVVPRMDPVPALGAHNEALFMEFGLGCEEKSCENI